MPTTYPIPNGRTVMDATLFTGTGGAATVVNTDLGTTGFKPDFIWMKNRTISQNHYSVDTVQGISNVLRENSTQAATSDSNFVTAVNSNGFSIGSSGFTSGENIVAWQWQAGAGTTSSNTAGSITSTVSVNQPAGFSVVTYTGNGVNNASIGHGLGATPKFILVKNRSTAQDWIVETTAVDGSFDYLKLNTTGAKIDSSETAPTSSVFYVASGPDLNQNGSAFVAYCWAPVAGFSQFGSYTGNGSSDGPFVYTGFRPRWVLYKIASGSENWYLLDTARDTYNLSGKDLMPNLNNAEATTGGSFSATMDILSNGFKLRDGGFGSNSNGQTYIYACFAENPFKYANAR